MPFWAVRVTLYEAVALEVAFAYPPSLTNAVPKRVPLEAGPRALKAKPTKTMEIMRTTTERTSSHFPLTCRAGVKATPSRPISPLINIPERERSPGRKTRRAGKR